MGLQPVALVAQCPLSFLEGLEEFDLLASPVSAREQQLEGDAHGCERRCLYFQLCHCVFVRVYILLLCLFSHLSSDGSERILYASDRPHDKRGGSR